MIARSFQLYYGDDLNSITLRTCVPSEIYFAEMIDDNTVRDFWTWKKMDHRDTDFHWPNSEIPFIVTEA